MGPTPAHDWWGLSSNSKRVRKVPIKSGRFLWGCFLSGNVWKGMLGWENDEFEEINEFVTCIRSGVRYLLNRVVKARVLSVGAFSQFLAVENQWNFQGTFVCNEIEKNEFWKSFERKKNSLFVWDGRNLRGMKDSVRQELYRNLNFQTPHFVRQKLYRNSNFQTPPPPL